MNQTMSIERRREIEGMEVSVDVDTADSVLGRRYFGTVTEVMDCDDAKHGVILLVQEAKPNWRDAERRLVPADTLDRLLIGKATEGDQMLAYNALLQQ